MLKNAKSFQHASELHVNIIQKKETCLWLFRGIKNSF
jgi:hypothetical protein